jgi:hypothetical protein
MIEKILALSRGTGKEENVILPWSAPKEVCALFLDHLDILIRNQKRWIGWQIKGQVEKRTVEAHLEKPENWCHWNHRIDEKDWWPKNESKMLLYDPDEPGIDVEGWLLSMWKAGSIRLGPRMCIEDWLVQSGIWELVSLHIRDVTA